MNPPTKRLQFVTGRSDERHYEVSLFPYGEGYALSQSSENKTYTVENLSRHDATIAFNLLCTVNKVRMLCVCAWCNPHSTIYAEYPELIPLPLSHGICQTHYNAYLHRVKES